jgi:hypothetical protein
MRSTPVAHFALHESARRALSVGEAAQGRRALRVRVRHVGLLVINLYFPITVH